MIKTGYEPCWATQDAEMYVFDDGQFDGKTLAVFASFAEAVVSATPASGWMEQREHDMPMRYILAHGPTEHWRQHSQVMWGALTEYYEQGYNVMRQLPQRRDAIMLEFTDCEDDFATQVAATLEPLGFIDHEASGTFVPSSLQTGSAYFAVVFTETQQAGHHRVRVHEELRALT